MSEPRIILGSDTQEGLQNRAFKRTQERLKAGRQFTDLSTICVRPSRDGHIAVRVVQAWEQLLKPMNNKYIAIDVTNMEVGEAYSTAVQMILDHPDLSKWKFLLTLESDNLPPADGLLKLYENICHCKKVCTDHYAAVGGLYFTKGEGGQPMIYGDPKGILAFQPQYPVQDKVQECNGLGMGFTLFRLDLFKDKRFTKPWFKTVQSREEGMGTQDLYFFGNARRLGYRVASDNRVRVGHWDEENGIAW